MRPLSVSRPRTGRYFLAFWASLLATALVVLRADAAPQVAPGPGASTTAASSDDEGEKVAPDSPRASISEYLRLCRESRFEDASRFLEFARPPQPRDGAIAAEHVAAVLRRYLLLDLDDVSPLSTGSLSDGLPNGAEELGRIELRGVPPDPVRLVKRHNGDGTDRWVVSKTTVERLERIYASLDDRWLRERLPIVLLRAGPRDLLWWQWLALPAFALVAALVGYLLAAVAYRLLQRLLQPRWPELAEDGVFDRFRAPLWLGCGVAALAASTPWLALDRSAVAFIHGLLIAGVQVTVFWGLFRGIDMSSHAVRRSHWGIVHPAGAGLLPLLRKAVKIALLGIASVAVLSDLGYPVASIIAGLGIGGLALALAAQKTVENLFGAASLAFDQPFRIGDFVQVDGVKGFVEAIGLRSTRIRTTDRTLVSMPNAKLAEMRIENFTSRDRFRLQCVLHLACETASEQIRAVLRNVELRVRAHPNLWPDFVNVALTRLGPASTEVEVNAWFQGIQAVQFDAIRQQLLLEFLDAVAESGAHLASPPVTTALAPPTCDISTIR